MVFIFLFVCQPTEDPNTFLRARPLSSPVVVVCETNCILAIGTTPVLTFPKEDIDASVTYLMACHYIFHLTYPKCVRDITFMLDFTLDILSTQEFLDAIHNQDMTFKIFIEVHAPSWSVLMEKFDEFLHRSPF